MVGLLAYHSMLCALKLLQSSAGSQESRARVSHHSHEAVCMILQLVLKSLELSL